MSNFNPQGGGLQYLGTRAASPPNTWTFNHAPTIYDTQGFSLGDFWIYVNSATKINQSYILLDLYGDADARRSLAQWQPLVRGTGNVSSLTGNDAIIVNANPSGNINLLGAGPITVSGTLNTETISIAVATTSSQGSVQLSSNADTIAGTDANTAVTPASLAAKLGTQTINAMAYGDGTTQPIQWTNAGAAGTVLTGTSGVPAFSATPTVTEMTITGTVTNPTDAATKAYVDAVSAGFTFIAPVRVATTSNLTATYANGAAGVGATLTNSGAQAAITIDGVALNMSDRVLVKNQSTTFQNGIYTVTTVGTGATNWVLTRATDYNTAPSPIKPGNIVPVTSGSTNASTLWLQTATVATIGADPIIFVPFGIEPVTPLPINEGGTNATSFATTDGVVYFDGTRLVTTSAGTAGQVLTSNGAGVAPTYQANSGSGNVITTIYSSPGPFTWTANVATQSVEIYGWGGGGGGSYGAGTVSGGGGGGGAFYYFGPIALFSSPVSGVVGAGGTAGVLPTGIGGNGGITSFGNFVSGNQASQGGIPGGNGGVGGFVFTMTTNGVFNYTLSQPNAPINTGGGNGQGSARNINNGSMLPAGGGSGGSGNNAGGSILNPATSAVITAGGIAGTSLSPNGGNGASGDTTDNFISGGAGGGGGFGTGTGGNGGFPGGGGGSGGIGGANGGTGGGGLVIVIEYT